MINFNPLTSGNYVAFVLVESNGGSAVFDVVRQGGDYPVAKIEFQTPGGSGWVSYNNASYFTFGIVTENTSLVISKCEYQMLEAATRLAFRPRSPNHPFGNAGLIGAANNIDLAERTISYAG
jgi:hypothetical protein